MFTNYRLLEKNGNIVLYLYVDYNYEFGKFGELLNPKNIADQIKDYMKKMKIGFQKGTIILVSSGIILTSIVVGGIKPVESSLTSITQPQIVENFSGHLETIPDWPKEDIAINPKEESKTEKKEEQKKTETKVENQTKPNQNQTKPTTPVIPPTPPKQPIPKPNEPVAPPKQEGILVTVKRSSGITIQIGLEDYVIGVVASEMPASFSSEALKAQAVVARTFVLKRMQEGKSISDTIADQVYKDSNQLQAVWGKDYQKYYDKVKTAVTATKGEVAFYQGDLIDAVYSSTTNGKTEDAQYVWGYSFPYLKSVDSHWDLGATPYYKVTTKTTDTVSKLLGVPLSSTTSVSVLEKSVSDRVNQIQIGDQIYQGIKLYQLLGLRSRDFDIAIDDNNVTITTRGYGHGVGMSQYGANGMAKEGYTYQQILKHYYQGITIGVKS